MFLQNVQLILIAIFKSVNIVSKIIIFLINYFSKIQNTYLIVQLTNEATIVICYRLLKFKYLITLMKHNSNTKINEYYH